MSVSVRQIRTQDKDEWLALWSAYNAFYGREGDSALSKDIVDTTWTRLLSDSEPVFGLLAELEGSPVGLAHYVFHRNLIQISDTCYLQDLFTAPASRGHGAAKRLVKAVKDHCLSRGVHDVYWHTQETNAAARGLYDQIARDTGFIVYRADVP